MDKIINNIKWLSSLSKVFPTAEPESDLISSSPSFFSNEVFSIQCAFYVNGRENHVVRVELGGSLSQYARIRRVCLMPVKFAARTDCDENYISAKPGLYPDLLRDIKDGLLRLYAGQWQSLFVTIDLSDRGEEELPVGEGNLWINFYQNQKKDEPDAAEVMIAESNTTLVVRKEKLPAQKLYHTEWFHTDCLADYYRVEPWSGEHWEILEHFIDHYAKTGMNTILVPTFTPALDTAVGQERTTVQLVAVSEENGTYTFGFDSLYQFICLCRRAGIRYFEIAHLFTQWGAKAAPKVMGMRDGRMQQLFGWETDAKSPEYLEFLKQYLTALTGKLEEWELHGKVFFHLSDEPEEGNREDYADLKQRIVKYLDGYPVLDAVSRYSFYEQGIVEKPVPGIDHLEPFLEHQVPHLWTYYCNAQDKEVSNRFFAMPSARNRVLGVLLYYHNIEGFLHWGYNFYNSQYSLEHINPYEVTDAGGAFPSGDAFLVYPGADRYPEDSLRMTALAGAMQDIRALELLESLSSRTEVIQLIEECAKGKLTMTKYPHGNAFLLELREKVNVKVSGISEKTDLAFCAESFIKIR